jgi:hypothetical protein
MWGFVHAPSSDAPSSPFGEFGDAFAEKLTRRRIDRSEVAAGHACFVPRFLVGVKCDRHVSLCHETPFGIDRKKRLEKRNKIC